MITFDVWMNVSIPIVVVYVRMDRLITRISANVAAACTVAHKED